MRFFRNRTFFTCCVVVSIAVFTAVFVFSSRALAANGAISPVVSEHFAWNEVVGWLDFYENGSALDIVVTDAALNGYASSSAGLLGLNCSDNSSCGFGNWKVSNNGGGLLAGWAWNDAYGWVSFCGSDIAPSQWNAQALQWECPSNFSYGVTIDGQGNFIGYAWSEVAGWMSFCSQTAVPGASDCFSSGINYKVKENGWFPMNATGSILSVPFDTGVANGAQLNSIVWHGDAPGSSKVCFEIIGSMSASGPWSNVSQEYCGLSEVTIPLLPEPGITTNVRYFRYQVILYSSSDRTQSPVVRDVVVNWSP